MTLVVFGVRAGRSASAVNGAAAGCVCNDHSVAEHLGDDLDVRSFAAACACAGELEERPVELAAHNGVAFDRSVGFRKFCGVSPVVGFFCGHFRERFHGESAFRASVYAHFAAQAVERADLHTIFVTFCCACARFGDEAYRLVGQNFRFLENRADSGVRAYERAAVALYAVFRDPVRNERSNAAFFVLSGAGRDGAVCRECGYRQAVAVLSEDRSNEVSEVFVVGKSYRSRAFGGGCPAFRIMHFLQVGNCVVHASVVHVYYRVAFFAVGLFDCGFHVAFRFLVRNDVGQLEESGLHNGVDAFFGSDFVNNLLTVQSVELNVAFGDDVLHGSRKLSVHFFRSPDAVEKERAAFFDAFEHIVAGNVALVVASEEVGVVDEVRALDRLIAETQVRNGDAAGFLAVVAEITLSVFVGVVADDFDAVLVCADGAVGAQTVEHAAFAAFRSGIDFSVTGRDLPVTSSTIPTVKWLMALSFMF